MFTLSQAPILTHQPDFHQEEGAQVQFLGTVRASEDGKAISGIHYTAYLPMAEHLLTQVLTEGQSCQPPHRVFIQHRLGFVPIEQPSLLIQVFSKHSAEAFRICQHYLQAIKTKVPIWKQPVYLNHP